MGCRYWYSWRSIVLTLAAFFILAAHNLTISQPFESAAISFAGAGRSAIAWADYDNDHDLDVLVTGLGSDDAPLSILYRNDDGAFMETDITLVPVSESAVAWGDFDLDHDLDLLMCGNTTSGNVTLLYRNDGDVFTELDPGLPAVQGGDLCWVDIDNDSDLDIFITGSWIAKLYLNDNGVFSNAGDSFGYFSSSSADFGDFDSDGDMDLLINGDSGAGAVSKIFRNDEGTFTDIQAGLIGLMAGSADWVDYDNDGDLDVSVSGFNDALEAQFNLYLNESSFFLQVYPGIEGFATGKADWGDYDHDGDADLLLSGKATGCGAVAAGVYRNEGSGNFYKLSDEITPATRSSLGWADYDNDGDLDFIIAGLNLNDYPFTKIYLNTAGDDLFEENTPPTPPVDLTSSVDGSSVTLSWAEASDNQTATPGLSYSVRLGAVPGGFEVIAPMSLYPGGYKLTADNGNAGQTSSLGVGNLAPGTYYWSVQSIDQALEGSAFSAEQSFTITATAIGEIVNESLYAIWPNPARDVLNIKGPDGAMILEVSIFNLTGQLISIEKPGSNTTRLNISALQDGIYMIRVKYPGRTFSTLISKH